MNLADYRLLLVDDEPDILEFLQYNLKKEGYQVFIAENGFNAIKVALEVIPHLILLDVMMPGMDGVETCSELRKFKELSNSIILFLTARAEDYSQIAGFEAGADDYVTKPIKLKILQTRIRSLIKRVHVTLGSSDEFNNSTKEEIDTGLIIDRDRYVIITGNEEMLLPRKEFELLHLLYSKPNKVFTRQDIYNAVWGNDIVVGDRTIDVHIRKLREKIGDKYIKTVKGVGYKFVD